MLLCQSPDGLGIHPHPKAEFQQRLRLLVRVHQRKSTTARLFACYKVNGSVPATPDLKPADFPLEGRFEGNLAYFDLEPVDCLREFEHRLVIEWGKSALSWHQKGTTERTSWPSTPPSKTVYWL